MKVLHVISNIDPKGGGPAVALAGLTAAQAREGHDVRVLATYADPRPDDSARALEAHAQLRLIGPTSGPLANHPELASATEEMVREAEIVHIHAVWEQAQHLAARAAMKIGKPYIVRPCGMLDPWSLSQGRLKKRVYMLFRLRKNLNRAAALHFTSLTERDLTAPLHLRAPSIVEPNGIDLAEFETLPAKGTFRSRFPQLAGKRIVLFLSRLHPKKGLELLIPAFAQAAPPDAFLVIAGPDSENYQAKLEQLAAEHKIADRTLFTGMLRGADRIAALVDADLFVLPSYQENFGIAVVEALAAGTPVLISDQVNIHQEITQARVGAAVPTEVSALAAELKGWLIDESRRASAASNAREFVRVNYDWTQIAARWSAHYEAIVRR